MRISELGVVVPARDEQRHIGDCLEALEISRRRLADSHPGVRTRVLVVLDSCADATPARVAAWPGVEAVAVAHGCVGAARATGTARLVTSSRCVAEELWLAHTDADSVVPADWMTTMLRHAELGAQLVLGTVRPDADLDDQLRDRWHRRHVEADGHPHVHGANLGIRADTYALLGGWRAAASGEDVDLAARATAHGRLRIHRTAESPVTTSSRLDGRAPGGFSSYLRGLRPDIDLATPA